MSISFKLHICKRITTVDALVQNIVKVREASHLHKLWYRGHSCSSFLLVPSIGRPAEYAGLAQVLGRTEENQLLHRFRRRAYPQDRAVRNAGYAIFLARHHRLPTRLLDWTANALLGLYFCCFEHFDRDAQLWAFRQRHYDVLDAFEITQRADRSRPVSVRQRQTTS